MSRCVSWTDVTAPFPAAYPATKGENLDHLCDPFAYKYYVFHILPQPSQYRLCTQKQYRFAVISEAPNTYINTYIHTYIHGFRQHIL